MKAEGNVVVSTKEAEQAGQQLIKERETLPMNEPETKPQVRRSTRIRNPPKRYNPAEYDLT